MIAFSKINLGELAKVIEYFSQIRLKEELKPVENQNKMRLERLKFAQRVLLQSMHHEGIMANIMAKNQYQKTIIEIQSKRIIELESELAKFNGIQSAIVDQTFDSDLEKVKSHLQSLGVNID